MEKDAISGHSPASVDVILVVVRAVVVDDQDQVLHVQTPGADRRGNLKFMNVI